MKKGIINQSKVSSTALLLVLMLSVFVMTIPIMAHDGDSYTVFQLTNDEYFNYRSSIDSGMVTWVGGDHLFDKEIFLYDYDTNTTIQLTDNDYSDSDVQIDSGMLTWHKMVDGYHEVFLYDSATDTTKQLTDNDFDDMYPHIDSGMITWEEHDGVGDQEIFLATTVPPVGETETYIAYVDDMIQDVPDELFSRSAEDVPDVKDDFSDLLNDALEKIDDVDYRSAIEKLNRVNELKHEEITESIKRDEINSFIDTLIDYLETLL